MQAWRHLPCCCVLLLLSANHHALCQLLTALGISSAWPPGRKSSASHNSGADMWSRSSSSSEVLGPDAVQDKSEGAQGMQVDSQPAPSVPGAAAARPGSPPGKAPRKTPSRPAKVAHQAGKLGSAHLWDDPRPCICSGPHWAGMLSLVLLAM